MKRSSTVARCIVALLVAASAAAAQTTSEPSTNGAGRSTARPGSGAIGTEYVVGPGDKLRIEVYKDPQLSQSLQVRPDGKITLPLVGDIEAVGHTPMELRRVITKSLTEYMTNPVVTVIVVEASAATAYVVGEVNSPGAVTLQGGQLTVLQALALAGGLKDFADSRNIRVLRRSPVGVTTIAFDYKDAIRGGEAVYLRPGDTVVVPD